jgi:hypothetical protein
MASSGFFGRRRVMDATGLPKSGPLPTDVQIARPFKVFPANSAAANSANCYI